MLINAFKIALKQESKLRLFIVGNGTYDEWLSIAKPVWPKISFTGYLTSKSGNKYVFCIINNDPKFSESDKKGLEDYIIREAYLRL